MNVREQGTKRVLVTGGAGYIGSVLVRQLLRRGYSVRVLDILRSGGEAIIDLLDHPNFEFIRADVGDAEALTDATEDVWSTVHLAAIVGDPACARDPELARRVNLDASKLLYETCEAAGVERFVFASTCSNYGKMEGTDAFVTERSPLRPLSVYAETKVAFEEYLLGQPETNHCKPTCLRFATVYGLSPRIRFDLTVNQFTKELVLGRELVVFGEQFWRPYCHVQDLARSAVATLESELDSVAFDVFNVGSTPENYQKRDIIDLIKTEVSDARIKYVQKQEDPRDYRVNFDKIKGRIGFTTTKTVIDGIREVKYAIENGVVLNPDDPKYYNVVPTEVNAA